MKDITKRIFFFFIYCVLCFFLVSCEQAVSDVEKKPERKEGETEKEYLDRTDPVSKSVMIMKLQGEEVSTEGGGNNGYTMDIDGLSTMTANFEFSAYHIRKSGDYSTDGFVFSSDDVVLYNVTDNTCTVNIINVNALGSYVVKATSTVNELYDQFFVINVTGKNVKLEVTYSIDEAYINPTLTYTEEMKGGTISVTNTNLNLCSGAVYKFRVYDAGENGYTIKNITVNSTKPCVYFKDVLGAEGTFVCMIADQDSSVLTFNAGQTKVSISCTVKMTDLTRVSMEYIDPSDSSAESSICLIANDPIDEPDKQYIYQVKFNSVMPDASNQALVFCIDFEDWDIQDEDYVLTLENKFLDNPATEITNKGMNAQWYTKTTLFKTYKKSAVADPMSLFDVEVDGALRQLKIIPRNDTIFQSINHGTQNQHCYIYAKYKNDPDNSYRWKWRILIGGALSQINLYTVEGDKNVVVPQQIEIKTGSQTGWIMKAIYEPTTTKNHTTLWYIAKNTSSVQEYMWQIEGVSVKAKLPIPATVEGTGNGVATVLSFMEESTGPSVDDYQFKLNGMITDVFKKATHYLDHVTADGISTNFITYNNNGFDCALVCLNLESGIFKAVTFKNYGEASVVVKGLSSYPVPQEFTLDGKTLFTNYGKNTSSEQTEDNTEEFVQSFNKGFTGFFPSATRNKLGEHSGKTRVFYMDVENELHIRINTSFDIDSDTSASLSGNSVANRIFDSLSDFYVGRDRTIDIYLNSLWQTYKELPDYNDERHKKQCMSNEAELYLTINSMYTITMNIVVTDIWYDDPIEQSNVALVYDGTKKLDTTQNNQTVTLRWSDISRSPKQIRIEAWHITESSASKGKFTFDSSLIIDGQSTEEETEVTGVSWFTVDTSSIRAAGEYPIMCISSYGRQFNKTIFLNIEE